VLGTRCKPRSQKILIFFVKILYNLYVLDRFNGLILKIIFKNKKISLIYILSKKNYLKNNHYPTVQSCGGAALKTPQPNLMMIKGPAWIDAWGLSIL